MANYSVPNSTVPAGNTQVNIGSSYQGIILVAASTNPGGTTGAGGLTTNGGPLRRGKLSDILIGTNSTPADNFLEFCVHRLTVGTTLVWVGSISSVSSAYAEDLADTGAAACLVANTTAASSALGTITGQAWYIGINQRASYRWVAAPGQEIVYPAASSATGNNGLMLSARSGGYTSTVTGTIIFSEQ